MPRRILMWDEDTQIDFMLPTGKLYVPGAESIVENLRLLTGYGVNMGHLMSGSVDAHLPEDPEFKTYPEHCVRGTPGQRKIPETLVKGRLYIPPYQLTSQQLDEAVAYRGPVIFEKQTTDCGTNPNVAPYIREVQAARAVVYGVVIEICVDSAVRYLRSLGLDVAVVRDAIKELDSQKMERVFEEWERLGASFTTTAEVLQGEV